jgi:hypothetical protein
MNSTEYRGLVGHTTVHTQQGRRSTPFRSIARPDSRGHGTRVTDIIDERYLQILGERQYNLAVAFDRRRLGKGVLHEETRPQDSRGDPALLLGLLDSVMTAPDNRVDIRADH